MKKFLSLVVILFANVAYAIGDGGTNPTFEDGTRMPTYWEMQRQVLATYLAEINGQDIGDCSVTAEFLPDQIAYKVVLEKTDGTSLSFSPQTSVSTKFDRSSGVPVNVFSSEGKTVYAFNHKNEKTKDLVSKMIVTDADLKNRALTVTFSSKGSKTGAVFTCHDNQYY